MALTILGPGGSLNAALTRVTSLASIATGLPGQIVDVLDNYTATTNPTAANDFTQGYQPGSSWFNTTLNQEWTCLFNGFPNAGTAIWSFSGASYANGGANPVGEVTFAGSSTGVFGEEGNLAKYTGGIISPAATAADIVAWSYAIPANAFDVAGRMMTIEAAGSFANNTNNKRCKLFVGATTAVVGSAVTGGVAVADTGTYSTTGAVGWSIGAQVQKYGATGSNTQIATHFSAQMGATVGSLLPQQALTLTESASILIAVTCNATSATTDITFGFGALNWMN